MIRESIISTVRSGRRLLGRQHRHDSVHLAVPASAITVVYNWVPNPGQFGSGSLRCSRTLASFDPENFAGFCGSLTCAQLHRWSVRSNLASVTTNTAVVRSSGGAAGYLISGFTMCCRIHGCSSGGQLAAVHPQLLREPRPHEIQVQRRCISEQRRLFQRDNPGAWAVGAVVPVPAAVWLMGSGFAVLGGPAPPHSCLTSRLPVSGRAPAAPRVHIIMPLRSAPTQVPLRLARQGHFRKIWPGSQVEARACRFSSPVIRLVVGREELCKIDNNLAQRVPVPGSRHRNVGRGLRHESRTGRRCSR